MHAAVDEEAEARMIAALIGVEIDAANIFSKRSVYLLLGGTLGWYKCTGWNHALYKLKMVAKERQQND